MTSTDAQQPSLGPSQAGPPSPSPTSASSSATPQSPSQRQQQQQQQPLPPHATGSRPTDTPSASPSQPVTETEVKADDDATKTRSSKAKSCRECIRLKLKCSRTPWPCDKCVERGIAALCPGHQLTTRPYKKERESRKNSKKQGSSESAGGDQSNPADDGPSGSDPSRSGKARTGTPNGPGPVAPAAPKRKPSSSKMPRETTGAGGMGPSSDLSRPAEAAESPRKRVKRSEATGADHPANLDGPNASTSSTAMYARPSALSKSVATHTAVVSGSATPEEGAEDVMEERGTLMFEKSGKSSYYGPGSHSFLLAQPSGPQDGMYSRGVSPRSDSSDDGDSDEDGDNDDHDLGAGGEDEELNMPARASRSRSNSQRTGEGRPETLAAGATLAAKRYRRRPPSVTAASPSTSTNTAPASSTEVVRHRILDNPVSFIAIPGVLSPFGVNHLVEQLCAHLPPKAEARRAFRIYRQNVTWMYDPITSLDKLWEDFYGDQALAGDHALNGPRPSSRLSLHPHRVSLAFSVLSLGVLFDISQHGADGSSQKPKRDRRAEKYYHWAWAALQLSNPGDSNTLENVQTIHLVGQYLCNRKNGRNADSFFPLIGTAVRNAIALGLHREGRAWNLPATELEERRRLFWELYASDCFRSLAYGRPCSIQDAHVDATFPSKRVGFGLSDVFHTVKYQVVRLLNRILDVCQRPNVPYAAVLEFDRALRELWAILPAELNPPPTGGAPGSIADLEEVSRLIGDVDHGLGASSPSVRQLHIFLQGHTIVANINQSLLHLHRPWFVRALQQEQHQQQQQQQQQPPRSQRQSHAATGSTRDAFDSRFARSIVAVSESSRALIHTAQAVLDVTPTLGMAWNYFWQHCFNAGVCQCLQVLNSPSSITTFGAWDDVRRALAILRRARPDKDDVIWAGKIDLLERLQKRAEARLKTKLDAGKSNVAPGGIGGGRTGPDRQGALQQSSKSGASGQKTTADAAGTDAEGPGSSDEDAEHEQQLRLVGATSSIDRRGVEKSPVTSPQQKRRARLSPRPSSAEATDQALGVQHVGDPSTATAAAHLESRTTGQIASPYARTSEARPSHDTRETPTTGPSGPTVFMQHGENTMIHQQGAGSTARFESPALPLSSSMMMPTPNMDWNGGISEDVKAMFRGSGIATDGSAAAPPAPPTSFPLQNQQRSHDIWRQQLGFGQNNEASAYPLNSGSNDFIPSLSHSLVGSLLFEQQQNLQQHPSPAMPSHHNHYQGQSSEQVPPAHSVSTPSVDAGSMTIPHTGSALVAAPDQSLHRSATAPSSHSAHSFAQGAPLLNEGDSAQFDWLLTELLQGGNEPEASFWEWMFGAGATAGERRRAEETGESWDGIGAAAGIQAEHNASGSERARGDAQLTSAGDQRGAAASAQSPFSS